ncbi:hypothetical protein [Tessaracoccus sp.]
MPEPLIGTPQAFKNYFPATVFTVGVACGAGLPVFPTGFDHAGADPSVGNPNDPAIR